MMMSLVILIVLLLFRLHACETKRYEFVAFASSREGGATSLQEELRRPLGRRESLRQLLLRGGCLRSSSSSSSSIKNNDESIIHNLTEAWNKNNTYEMMYRRTEGLDTQRKALLKQLKSAEIKVGEGPFAPICEQEAFLKEEELNSMALPEVNKDPNLHKCYWRRNQTFYFWDEKYDEIGNLGYVNIYIPIDSHIRSKDLKVQITTWSLRVWAKKNKNNIRKKEDEEEEKHPEKDNYGGNGDFVDGSLDNCNDCNNEDTTNLIISGKFHKIVKTEDSLWSNNVVSTIHKTAAKSLVFVCIRYFRKQFLYE